MFIKMLLLVVFFAVTIGIGFYYHKSTASVKGFVLGGRSVGPWLTAFAYGTSYFSAVVFIGYAGQFGWRFGIAATWIGLGNAFIGSLMAWVILGRRTRIMTRHLNSSTMPEFFGARFNSNSLKFWSSIIIFIFLIPYTASLYNGLSRLFAMAFDIEFSACIVIMGVLTAVYVTAGGYIATAVNDFIQGTIMLIGIVAVILAVLKVNGGFTVAMEALAHVSDPSVSTAPGSFTSFFGPDPINLLGVILLTSLGTWGLPQMVQKFYAIQSEKVIFKGTVISTVFALIVAGGCYFLGGFGRLYAGQIDVAADGFDVIIPTMISSLSPLLIGVIVVLVLSASMSTLSSLVMASSSTFTLDFIKGIITREIDEKKQLLLLRMMIVIFIIISVIIALIQYNRNVVFIAQLMGISWGTLAGAFLAPFLYGLYWKRTSKISVWCCFIFSTVFMVLNMFVKSMFPPLLQSSINAGAFVMIMGLIIVPVVSLLTPAPDTALTAHCFECYNQPVTVKMQHALTGDTKEEAGKKK